MAFTNGWYDFWVSDECSDDTLTGNCDGIIPLDDIDAPGAYCHCACHDEEFSTIAEVEQYHSDKHRDEQDGAYHNVGYVGG